MSDIREVATELEYYFAQYSPLVRIGGSIRRNKPDPGDIEVVILTTPEAQDAAETLERRVSHYKGDEPVFHWGERSKRAIVDGHKVDLFFADADNWGYILWLRTGPGKGNEWVMKALAARRAQGRVKWGVKGGYVYATDTGERLRVPTEYEWFRMLGMPFVPPPLRDESFYREFVTGRDHALYRDLMVTPAPDVWTTSHFAGRKVGEYVFERGGKEYHYPKVRDDIRIIAVSLKKYYRSPFLWVNPAPNSINSEYNRWRSAVTEWDETQYRATIHSLTIAKPNEPHHFPLHCARYYNSLCDGVNPHARPTNTR